MTKRLNKAAEVASRTMTGDLRDVLIDIMRTPKLTGKAWKDMSEDEQRQVRDQITSKVDFAVSRAVDIIKSEGRQHVKVLLKSVTIKDGIKGSFEAPKASELRHELIDAQGDTCLIVLLGSEKYKGERAPVKIDKDQPELPTEPSKEKNANEEPAHNPETGEIIEEGEENDDLDTEEGEENDDLDTEEDDEDEDGFEDIED